VALDNGADVFLAKPFTKSQLNDAVMQLLHSEKTAAAM
jgi:FixJ family two-component response regulator